MTSNVAAVRGAGDRQDVVESHHRVGDDDRAHRAPEAVGVGLERRGMLGLVFRAQQPVGDPDQQRAADREEARDPEQPHDDERHRGSDDESAGGAGDDRAPLQVRRNVARREGDDDCVVAGQREVDHDDRGQRRGEFDREVLQGGPLR